MIDEKGMKLRNFHESNYNHLDNFDFNVRLLDRQLININTILIPSSLFNKGCLMRSLDDSITIDYDYFLRSGILFKMDFYLVEKTLLQYRIHKNQTSRKNILQSLKNLEKIKKDILSILDEKTRNKYNISIEKYSKEKKITKKIMEFGLKMITKILPEYISDQILVFYLNKIRSRR
jgi:hypothetical protein